MENMFMFLFLGVPKHLPMLSDDVISICFCSKCWKFVRNFKIY
jgi:hypothetical protein